MGLVQEQRERRHLDRVGCRQLRVTGSSEMPIQFDECSALVDVRCRSAHVRTARVTRGVTASGS